MKRIPFIFAALAFTLASCEKDDLLELKQSTRQTDKTELIDEIHEGEIQLGDKYESPLLLKNMQRAADTLSKRSGLRNAVILEPTHLYVRFLPKDSAEYEQLVADTVLDVTPYPLDYELTEGTVYHDKSLPYNSYQWQYAVVPIDYDLSSVGIHSEKLEELYMPDGILDEEDEDKNGALRSTSVSPSSEFSLSQLLTEAERQTEKENTTLKSRWTPGATIKVYDDLISTQPIPLKNVKVRICVLGFAKTHEYTNENGEVSFKKRRRSASYSVEWENEKWDIRDEKIQAYYNGPRQKSWWNLTIYNGNSKSLRYATIHRALQQYYYENTYGFTRPKYSIKVNYIEESPETNISGKFVHSKNSKHIEIYGSCTPDKVKNPTYDILSTTIHELTHASLWFTIGEQNYCATKPYIRESWADFAQWLITQKMYNFYNQSYKIIINTLYQNQNWAPESKEEKDKLYTPFFIDLYDSDNQNTKYSRYYPNDQINYFSVYQLSENIRNFHNLTDIENYLLSQVRNNPLRINQIKSYLNSYRKIWK